jgi:hypothetical protein
MLKHDANNLTTVEQLLILSAESEYEPAPAEGSDAHV